MATFYSNSSLYYQLKLDVTPRSQDVANNTSTLDWVLTLNMSHGYYFYSHECGTTVKIGGKTVHSSNKMRSFSSATPTVLERGTVTVTHNSDGSLNAGIYAYFDVAKSDYTPQVPLTINTSMRLSTIPRASTPTLSNSSIYYGQSVRIYTNRKSTSFTHTIRATWNGTSETIKSGVTDYYDWTVPDKYMDRIPNNTSTQGTIYLDTYNGSTKIGTKSINLTTNVPSHVNPYVKRAAIGIPNSFIEIDKKFGAYIQNKSKAYFIIESEGKYSSTIKTNQIVSNGQTLSSSRNPYEATTDYLRNSGTNTVTYKTIDSRGRTGSISKTYNVLAYESPKILSFNVQRSNADGTPAPNGEYARIEYKLNVTPLNDKNDKTYTLKYKRKDTNDAWTSVSLDNSSYSPNTYRTVSRVNADSSYVFRLEVKDYFESATSEASIGTASTFMEWREGGKGLSLGKFSEKDGLEVNWRSHFYQPVALDGGVIMQYTGDAGPGIDCNTTLLGRCVARIVANGPPNTPGWSYAYFNQDFYNGVVSTDTDRRQAIQDIYTGDTWTRVYSTGKWSPWIKSDFSPTKVPNGSDLNSYTTPGYYSQPSTAQTTNNLNMPEKVAFSLHVYANSGVTQIFTTYYNDVQRYIRSEYKGAWSKWELIPKESQSVRRLTYTDDSTSDWKTVLKNIYPGLKNDQAYMLRIQPHSYQVWAIGFRADGKYGAFIAFNYGTTLTKAYIENGQWKYVNLQ